MRSNIGDGSIDWDRSQNMSLLFLEILQQNQLLLRYNIKSSFHNISLVRAAASF
jgi:hypothetical protein